MTFLMQTEITTALGNHRLTSTRGWRNENGSTTFTCSCGHQIQVDQNPRHFIAPATLLAEHQAEVIERMGFSRTPDVFDRTAVETLVSLLHRRRHQVVGRLDTADRVHATAEQERLRGALAELSTLLAAVDELASLRATDGCLELPIDEAALAPA